MEEFLKDTKIDFNLSKERYYKILSDIQSEIRDNLNTIKRLTKVDFEYHKKNINLTDIEHLIEEQKENEIVNKERLNRIIFSYYGDPYITISLCLKAIATQTKIVLAIEDMMLGFNTALVKIISQVLSEYRMPNLILLKNFIKNEEILENKEYIDNIICIGNQNAYQRFKSASIPKLTYFAYQNIDLYFDSEAYEELKEKIYEYAYENQIEIEIYDTDTPLEEAIDQMNQFGIRDVCVLLSDNKKHIHIFKENIKARKILINQNPFKDEEFDIPTEYFLTKDKMQ